MHTAEAIRPDPRRPRTWPLAVKVPIQAALLTFLVATLSTQVALHFAREREDRVLAETLVPVLAATAAALEAAFAAEGGPDEAAARETLERIRAHAGAGSLLTLSANWRTADGAPGAAAAGDPPRGRDAPPGTDGRLALAATFPLAPAPGGAGEGALTVRLAAEPGALDAARSLDQVRVAAVDVLVAILGALAALWFVRGALRPVESLTARLLAGETDANAPPADGMEPLSTEFGRLQRVMVERVAAERERAAALYQLAEKERATVLAKLAAGMAHEVRNPLAGLLNAVSTLRRFGEDPAVRAESLDLLERGLRSIERVAAAALSTYRPERAGAGLSRQDLSDLGVLAEPEARRRGVALSIDVALDGPFEADPDAVRQVFLNLLLNAVKASGPGGRVDLVARVADGELAIAVTDTGPGLPGDVRRFLSAGGAEPVPRPDALGLWTVLRILDDVDGRLSVDTHPGRGTTVSVRVPVSRAGAAWERAEADRAPAEGAEGGRP